MEKTVVCALNLDCYVHNKGEPTSEFYLQISLKKHLSHTNDVAPK